MLTKLSWVLQSVPGHINSFPSGPAFSTAKQSAPVLRSSRVGSVGFSKADRLSRAFPHLAGLTKSEQG
eukprot:9194624-Pyramimonas_sp.AAC.1